MISLRSQSPIFFNPGQYQSTAKPLIHDHPANPPMQCQSRAYLTILVKQPLHNQAQLNWHQSTMPIQRPTRGQYIWTNVVIPWQSTNPIPIHHQSITSITNQPLQIKHQYNNPMPFHHCQSSTNPPIIYQYNANAWPIQLDKCTLIFWNKYLCGRLLVSAEDDFVKLQSISQ